MIEAITERMRRRERRRKQLLNDLRGKQKMLEFERGNTVVQCVWRRRFGRACGPPVNTENRMNVV
jgi:hypothetical protein